MKKYKGYMAFNHGRPLFSTLTRDRPWDLGNFFNGCEVMIEAYYEGQENRDDRMTIEKVVVKKVEYFNEENAK